MPENKKSWVHECANAFGMTVTEFAEFTGYTRQALYLANRGDNKLDPRKLALVQSKLDAVSEKMYADEKAKAQADFEKRNRLIEELAERLSI